MKPIYTGCSTRCTRPSPILPAVFDDIMSYEQQIAKLCESFNELNEYVESSIDGIKSELNSLVINQVNALVSDLRLDFIHLSGDFDNLESEFNTLNGEFETFKNETTEYINTELNDFWIRVNNRITDVQKVMTDQYNALRQYIDQLNQDTLYYSQSYTDAKIAALNADVKDKLDSMQKQLDDFAFGNITVSNWFTHTKTSLQQLLDNMWDYMRGCALDSREVDLLPLSAQTIDDLNLPAYQYDTESWRRLYFNLVFVPEIKKLIEDKTSMRDPYTGQLIPVSDVTDKIFDSINFNGKTLTEYDALGVTAGEFDQSDFDAFTQDTDKNWTRVMTDTKNKFLPFRTLVWENPDQSKSPEGWVSIDLTSYNIVEIEVGYNSYLSYPITLNRPVNGYIYDGSGQVNTVRGFTVRPDLKAIMFNSGDNLPIPYRIYGVNYNELV